MTKHLATKDSTPPWVVGIANEDILFDASQCEVGAECVDGWFGWGGGERTLEVGQVGVGRGEGTLEGGTEVVMVAQVAVGQGEGTLEGGI